MPPWCRGGRHRRVFLCGALLLVDQDSGHSISETMWDSHKALAASRGEAAAVRVETVRSTGALIRAVEEYDLVFSTARASAGCDPAV